MMHSNHRSVRPHHLPWLPSLVAVLIWLLGAAFARAGDAVKAGYETGHSNVFKIANELHVALEPRKQQAVQPSPVFRETVMTPSIAPVELDGGTQKTVEFSAGFVGLLNALSHAKALSEPGDGFLKQYAARLATAGETLPSVTEGVAHEKAWDFDIMNHQAGQFNQMAGALVAIDLAHHYLGHYKKYAAQLAAAPAGATPPITTLVTEKEWREAVLKGAKNALDCGLGVDGLKTVFECMEAMPNRPNWSAYFVPPKANLTKLSKDLQRLENDFFLVEK